MITPQGSFWRCFSRILMFRHRQSVASVQSPVALPTNPPEWSHRVWSRNGREGCSGMLNDITQVVHTACLFSFYSLFVWEAFELQPLRAPLPWANLFEWNRFRIDSSEKKKVLNLKGALRHSTDLCWMHLSGTNHNESTNWFLLHCVPRPGRSIRSLQKIDQPCRETLCNGANTHSFSSSQPATFCSSR